MRHRRALAILAAACLAALAAACTGSSGDAPPAATQTAPPAAPTATPTATPTPTPAPTPGATPTATPPTATATQTPVPTPSATPTATPPTATATPTPATKRYDRLDPTGEAATPGSWAILGADGGVLTDWEALRADAASLRLHQTDASGTSWATEFGAVESGDIIEWRKADDCWVRYRVTGAPTRPASGSSRQEFPVERVSYAPTGCAGAIPPTAALRAEPDPRDLDWTDVTSPLWHGPYLLYPRGGWSGTWPGLPSPLPGPVSVSSTQDDTWPSSDPAVVRRHPLWRDPDLPTGWTLSSIGAADADRLEAWYANDRGYLGVEIHIFRYTGHARIIQATRDVVEIGTIESHPAVIHAHGSIVELFDENTGVMYIVYGHDSSLRRNAEAVMAIARSLLPTAGAP